MYIILIGIEVVKLYNTTKYVYISHVATTSTVTTTTITTATTTIITATITTVIIAAITTIITTSTTLLLLPVNYYHLQTTRFFIVPYIHNSDGCTFS